MIENPALLIWQGFLITFVAAVFLSAAWFLAWGFWGGTCRHRYLLAIIFIGLALIVTVECWLEDNIYGWLGFIPVPGIVADLLVFNRTDIPENDPDLWQTAWLVAPLSALLWTALLFGVGKGLRFLARSFSRDRGWSA